MKTNRKNCKIIMLIIVIVLMITTIVACNSGEEMRFYELKYSSTEGGTVHGNNEQKVQDGYNGSQVTAIANKGYKFVGWSDGIKTENRFDKNIQNDIAVTASFEEIQGFNVNYSCTEGGFIQGEATQMVLFDQYSTFVNAIAKPNYNFVGWSDGYEQAVRHDKVNANFNVEAIFALQEYTLSYGGNTGGFIQGERIQILKHGDSSQSVTAIPLQGYEFLSWSDGVMTASRTDLDIKRNIKVRANFASQNATRHKILLVYVTELNAELLSKDNETITVNYAMSELEKQFYDIITLKFSAMLNDIFDGSVIFEVDAFFTSLPLGASSLYPASNEWYSTSYGISAKRIPQIQSIIGNYRTIITTFGMDDYKYKLHNEAGSGKRGEAFVHTEALFSGFVINNEPLEPLLKLNEPIAQGWWKFVMELYLHEFTHTAEGWYWYDPNLTIPIGFHEILSIYSKNGVSGIEPIKLFLLGKAEYEGKLIGIPKNFWEKEPDI